MPRNPGSKYGFHPVGDTLELGSVRITPDMPEVGLVTLAYEPSLSEYNLDAPDGEQTMTLPDLSFRKAVKEYLGLE